MKTASFSSDNIILYHGSPNKSFVPTFGLGEFRHDYGAGFYLTEFAELAKEWAMCSGNDRGYLHQYKLDLNGLKIFDFATQNELVWLAELMSHRDADTTLRYRRLAPEFIERFKLDLSDYDVIKGWRADSSYFSIAKRFVRDEIDYELLAELLRLGNLQTQYCLKSERAFKQLHEIAAPLTVGTDYRVKYDTRDSEARSSLEGIINSSRNTMQHGLSYVLSPLFDTSALLVKEEDITELKCINGFNKMAEEEDYETR